MWIKQIELTDDGDGSTSVVITMTNGAEIRINEQIPYDGKVVVPFGPNGDRLTTQVHQYDYEKDEWGPDEYAD